VLSNRNVRTSTADTQQVVANGQIYQRLTITVKASNQLHNAARHGHQGSLIDGGTNGGMNGSDVRVLEQTLHHADVSGLGEHTVTDLPIVTAAGVLQSNMHILVLVKQSIPPIRCYFLDLTYAISPVISVALQCIHHHDGHVIPLSIHNGLPYINMHPPIDLEL
jgi:hypothetical protein